MRENDKKIRPGAGKRHDPTCYQLLQDIVIPAGTMLRSDGAGKFATPIGMQSAAFTGIAGNAQGNLVMDMSAAPDGVFGYLKKVVSA